MYTIASGRGWRRIRNAKVNTNIVRRMTNGRTSLVRSALYRNR